MYRIFFFCFFLIGVHSTLSSQCVSGDCKDGKGTYVYPSGAKYVGEFKGGEIHGIGVCYYTDGSKYSGEWKFRFPDGRGTKIYSDGTKRTGSWRRGKPVDDAGNILEEYIAKKKEENVEDDTNIQSGCLSGDCQNGIGAFAYPDGSKYEGEFVNGKFAGEGRFVFANGDIYAGAFKDNYPHGQGKRTRADNMPSEEGEWREGEFIGANLAADGKIGCIEGDCSSGTGTFVFKEGAARYTGQFLNDQPHGKGVCSYANGDKFEGDWKEGAFGGMGTLTLRDGTIVTGHWLAGEYIGQTPPEGDLSEQDSIKTNVVDVSNTSDTTGATDPVILTKVWAVVVGVASYDHMPALRYTDDDAYRFYAFLKSVEGGALPDDQIRILIDEAATKDNITESIIDIFGQAGENDLVVFYFSGHGLNGSFLPIDFDGFNNKLAHEELAKHFSECKAKFKLCVADACHSGSLIAMRSADTEPVLMQYYQTLAKSVSGTALLMSSKGDETSLESAGLRQGVFSHFLIRGLKGEADTNGDKVVSVKELFDYIYNNVRAYTGNRQSPVLKGAFDPSMPIGVTRGI